MNSHFKKTVFKNSFESLVHELETALQAEGFTLGGKTDFFHTSDKEPAISKGKHQILTAYIPFLYKEMLSLSPFEGIILPCMITVIETHPGVIAVVPFSPTESIVSAIHSPSLQNLSAEITRRLELAVQAIRHEESENPDLVTSWS
jgi:uncharacterized protein (DUF302 family)